MTYITADECLDIEAAIDAAFVAVTGRRVKPVQGSINPKSERRLLIEEGIRSGKPLKDIAQVAGVTHQRVSQIAIKIGCRRRSAA